MQFFSGFCLRNDASFFMPWLKQSDYTVAGFSYGAIKALQHALDSKTRIDTLQLFSPAYFCNKSDGFKRLQLKGYRRDSAAYRSRFLESCFAPYPVGDIDAYDEGEDALEELLTYAWPGDALQAIKAQGVRIEVYLGSSDAVIDADEAREFFKLYATVHYIKNANHFLQGDKL